MVESGGGGAAGQGEAAKKSPQRRRRRRVLFLRGSSLCSRPNKKNIMKIQNRVGRAGSRNKRRVEDGWKQERTLCPVCRANVRKAMKKWLSSRI